MLINATDPRKLDRTAACVLTLDTVETGLGTAPRWPTPRRDCVVQTRGHTTAVRGDAYDKPLLPDLPNSR